MYGSKIPTLDYDIKQWRSIQDDSPQIQIMAIVNFLVILNCHMNIIFIITSENKIFFLL